MCFVIEAHILHRVGYMGDERRQVYHIGEYESMEEALNVVQILNKTKNDDVELRIIERG